MGCLDQLGPIEIMQGGEAPRLCLFFSTITATIARTPPHTCSQYSCAGGGEGPEVLLMRESNRQSRFITLGHGG